MISIILIILILFGYGASSVTWWLAAILAIVWFFRVWYALAKLVKS